MRKFETIILKFLRRYGAATTHDVAKVLGISWHKAQLYLSVLAYCRKIRFRRVGRQNEWELMAD